MRFAKIGEREITEIVRYFVQVDSCYMLCVQNDFKDLSWWLLLIQFGNQEQEALAAVGSLMKTNFILYSGCRRVTQPGMHCACGLKFILACSMPKLQNARIICTVRRTCVPNSM